MILQLRNALKCVLYKYIPREGELRFHKIQNMASEYGVRKELLNHLKILIRRRSNQILCELNIKIVILFPFFDLQLF